MPARKETTSVQKPESGDGRAPLEEERFDALVRGVSEYAIFLLDETGRILSWNRGAERMKLFRPQEVIGQPVACLYLPEDVSAGVPGAVLRRTTEQGNDLTHGWRLRRDGSRFWASVVTMALYDDLGRVRGYLKVVRDDTALHAEEQEHEAALRWMRILTHACPVGLLVLDASATNRMWANRRAAEFLGGDPGLMTFDVRAERLLYPDGRPVPLEERPLRRALRGESTIESEEFLVRRPDGSLVPILAIAAPVRDADEKITGAVAAFHDISAVKRIEQRREKWTALIAHELRQPLGSIVASLGLLASARGDEERVRRSVDIITRNARRLDRIIGDLLDVSRMEGGVLHVDARPVEVEDHARAAADRAMAGATQRQVRVHTHGSVPAMRADPDRLDQILDNLLSNAVRYGDPNSEVTVDLEPAIDGVAVAVTSRGPGIAAEDLPRLFQPFQRDISATRVTESVGLGLYITKGLVEAQGGHIEATSSPGAETTFRFVLPAAA